MALPFTTDQFISVFESYNRAIGPAPVLAYLLGAAALFLVFKGTKSASLAATTILAGFWAFTGVGYHLLSFSAINPASRAFGIAFVAQAVMLAVSGLRGKLRFRYAGDGRSKVGLALVAWSMVGYPLAGVLLGHGYPHGPVFALTPCPLLIFTFGMLLLADRPPLRLGTVLLVWTVVGTSAAFLLGIREDLTLAASAAVFFTLRLSQLHSDRHAARAATPPKARPVRSRPAISIPVERVR